MWPPRHWSLPPQAMRVTRCACDRPPGPVALTEMRYRSDPPATQRELVKQLDQWGQRDIEVLTGDEARTRFAFVGPDVVQARFRAGDGFLDTKQLTFGLAEASGAEVVLRTRATGFDTTPDGS